MINEQVDLMSFAENLIKSAGFGAIEEQFRNDMKEQIVSEANKRIGMMVISEMNEEELQKYQELLQKNESDLGSKEVQKYVSETISELPQKIVLTLKMYRDEFVSATKASKT